MESLPLFHRLAGQPVLVVGEGEAAAAKARLIQEAGGIVVQALQPGVRLAFVALDDGAEAVAEELRAAGLLVNVVDRPALCDFTVPAIIDRAPVTVAVGTAGASAKPNPSEACPERLPWQAVEGRRLRRRATRSFKQFWFPRVAYEGARRSIRKERPARCIQRRSSSSDCTARPK